jgi:FAD/FMN-containing dehydrogenase
VKIHGWGRYPVVDVAMCEPRTVTELKQAVCGTPSLIARGLGRSYGDSALSPNVISTCRLDHFQSFDAAKGILSCAAGVSLNEILSLTIPRGWFLPVTPGTKYVTVGGAIAADVHGKNHHCEGTFGTHVRRLTILLGSGEIVSCSPQENAQLFHATCGGMGLTGIVIAATIQLKRINSSVIVEHTLKGINLEQTLDLFSLTEQSTYSVAWIDCVATGKKLGRSLVMVGEHADEGTLHVHSSRTIDVSIELPSTLINSHSIGAFNALYYHRMLKTRLRRRVSYESYFYPLDKLSNWNRLYGRSGFLQYQFAIPKAAGVAALKDILQRIALTGKASFLAVLKAFGPANSNLLSFPLEGWTLALDFQNSPSTHKLLDELDRPVLAYGGKIYLAKDARMSEHTFKEGYEHWQTFEEIRAQHFALGRFGSLQSRRIGLQ